MEKQVIVFFIALLATAICQQKYYNYGYIYETVTLNTNGQATFLQEREYRFFNGYFSNAFLALYDPYYKVTDGSVYEVGNSTTYSFSIVRDGVFTRLSWSFIPTNTYKRFQIRYTIRDVIYRYQDYGHFFWKMLEHYHASIDFYKASVILPSGC